MTIPDEVLEEAVRIADVFITDRQLPDKALDLLDQACARQVHSPGDVVDQSSPIEPQANDEVQEDAPDLPADARTDGRQLADPDHLEDE